MKLLVLFSMRLSLIIFCFYTLSCTNETKKVVLSNEVEASLPDTTDFSTKDIDDSDLSEKF